MTIIINYTEKLLLLMLSLLLSGIVILIGLQVFLRYALDAPLTWSEEVARYLMVWFSLIGAVLGIRHYSHVGVDFFIEKLPSTLQLFVRVVKQAVSLIFISVIAVKGFDLSMDKFFIPSPAASIPMGVVYLSIPVSGALMFIFQLEVIVKDFLHRPVVDNERLGEHLRETGGTE